MDSVAIAIYARQKDRLQYVRVWKPDMAEGRIEATLAPLLLEETRSDGAGQGAGPADGVVHTFVDGVPLGGNTCIRVAYWWSVRSDDRPQGVRVTLGLIGVPVLWETLRDPSGKNVSYVSRLIETAAAAQYGPPLGGRRFAVEPSLDKAGYVVARVLDDGPVPMGPIVYLRQTNAEMATVICRCMPSQADNVVETRTYKLQPENASAWPQDASASDVLRWPAL